jgi:hypothetical protein
MAEKIVLVIVVFLISSFTLLWRIDGTALWRDEASTATIAREMVERKTLIPRLFNGEYLLAQRPDGRDSNDQFVEAINGWLQYYVAAVGFLLAPPGTVSARLPFVAVGALSLWILYRVGCELFAGTVIRLAAPRGCDVHPFFNGGAAIALLCFGCTLYLLHSLGVCPLPKRARVRPSLELLSAVGTLGRVAVSVQLPQLWRAVGFAGRLRPCDRRPYTHRTILHDIGGAGDSLRYPLFSGPCRLCQNGLRACASPMAQLLPGVIVARQRVVSHDSTDDRIAGCVVCIH